MKNVFLFITLPKKMFSIGQYIPQTEHRRIKSSLNAKIETLILSFRQKKGRKWLKLTHFLLRFWRLWESQNEIPTFSVSVFGLETPNDSSLSPRSFIAKSSFVHRKVLVHSSRRILFPCSNAMWRHRFGWTLRFSRSRARNFKNSSFLSRMIF